MYVLEEGVSPLEIETHPEPSIAARRIDFRCALDESEVSRMSSEPPSELGKKQQGVSREDASVAPLDKARVHEEDKTSKADRRPDEPSAIERFRPQNNPIGIAQSGIV